MRRKAACWVRSVEMSCNDVAEEGSAAMMFSKGDWMVGGASGRKRVRGLIERKPRTGVELRPKTWTA